MNRLFDSDTHILIGLAYPLDFRLFALANWTSKLVDMDWISFSLGFEIFGTGAGDSIEYDSGGGELSPIMQDWSSIMSDLEMSERCRGSFVVHCIVGWVGKIRCILKNFSLVYFIMANKL